MPDTSTYQIEYLRGSRFEPLELNRTVVNTIDQFRGHMEISPRAVITVKTGSEPAVQRDGAYEIQSGDIIAAVESDKTGGK